MITLLILALVVMLWAISYQFIYWIYPHSFQVKMCNAIGWHKVGAITSFDGCSQHATCKICGYMGMIDSQGNLF